MRLYPLGSDDDAGGWCAVTVAGKTYLERGRRVTVLIGWGPGGGPRNVLIERGDSSRVVRPFRGLRKILEVQHG